MFDKKESQLRESQLVCEWTSYKLSSQLVSAPTVESFIQSINQP